VGALGICGKQSILCGEEPYVSIKSETDPDQVNIEILNDTPKGFSVLPIEVMIETTPETDLTDIRSTLNL